MHEWLNPHAHKAPPTCQNLPFMTHIHARWDYSSRRGLLCSPSETGPASSCCSGGTLQPFNQPPLTETCKHTQWGHNFLVHYTLVSIWPHETRGWCVTDHSHPPYMYFSCRLSLHFPPEEAFYLKITIMIIASAFKIRVFLIQFTGAKTVIFMLSWGFAHSYLGEFF